MHRIPALLIKMSILSTIALISAAALRTEIWLARSSLTNLVLTLGLSLLIFSITGTILDSVRPPRIISLGLAWAKEIAVAAPIPPSLGPVMTTR